MLEELGNLTNLIWEMLPFIKIILSARTIKVDKCNANENNIDFFFQIAWNNWLSTDQTPEH